MADQADVVQVTIGPPPEDWKIVENVVVEKLLGLEVIALSAQFDERVRRKRLQTN